MQRRFRLRRSEDFRRLRESGVTQRHPLMVLSFTPNGEPHNRYGFIVSKRFGSAVKRNRMRRRLREIMRTLHPAVLPGYDIVIIVRQPLTQQPYAELLRIVRELLRRAQLLVKEDAS